MTLKLFKEIPESIFSRFYSMAPVPGSPMEQVEKLITNNKVMVFSKTTCPFCVKIKQLFDILKIKYEVLELDQEGRC